MEKRKIVLISGLVLVFLIALTLVFFSSNVTGLFGLSVADYNDANSFSSTLESDLNDSSVFSSLSYAVLEKTTLSVSLSDTKLVACPSESIVDFNITNTGTRAEKVKIIFPSFIKVLRCKNCETSYLERNDTLEVSAVLCKIDSSTEEVRVVSANSDDVAFKIN